MKTIIVLPTGIGDCLIPTPAIESYKKQTGAEITIACRPDRFPLFDLNPSVDHLTCEADAMFGNWDERLVLQGMIVDQPRGKTDCAYELACDLMGVPYPESLLPRLYLRESERNWAKRYIESRGLIRPLIGFAPTASSIPRTLPASLSVGITELLKSIYPDCSLIAFGEQGHEGAIAGCHALDRVEFGTLTTRRMIALISELDLLVGVDSAPMHIAAAIQIPQVALFTVTPPETRVKNFDCCRALMTREACAPCYAKTCERIDDPSGLPGIARYAPCTAAFDLDEIKGCVREVMS